MPFLIPGVITALTALFVGSQVDNAVQSSFSGNGPTKEAMPLWMKLAIGAVVALIVWKLVKKFIK